MLMNQKNFDHPENELSTTCTFVAAVYNEMDERKLHALKTKIRKRMYKPDTRKAAVSLLLELAKTQTQKKM